MYLVSVGSMPTEELHKRQYEINTDGFFSLQRELCADQESVCKYIITSYWSYTKNASIALTVNF